MMLSATKLDMKIPTVLAFLFLAMTKVSTCKLDFS